MVSNVNLKARIERHSRIIKNNIWHIHPFRTLYNRFNHTAVLMCVVLLFPFYPRVSSFFYDNSYYDYYIDETTILDAYIAWEEGIGKNVFVSEDAFLSVNMLLENKRDMTWYNEIITYEVQSWDSFSSIAARYGISVNTILWANNFDNKKTLKPWEKIKVPPVSWLVHTIASWDTLWAIARKYGVWENEILDQNNLMRGALLRRGDILMIPGAEKKVEPPKQVVAQVPKSTPKTSTPAKSSQNTSTRATSSSQWWYSFATSAQSEYVETQGVYQLVKRKPQWTFYWGNCTWYVAQYKNVNWSWNANQWLRNAQAKWHPTGKNPWLWAIVVFQWRWYNPTYWHVWIVIDVQAEHIIISDMNYRKLNEVTVRKVPKTDPAIQWYIYVD